MTVNSEREQLRLDSIITLVDAENFNDDTLYSQVARSQLIYGDIILARKDVMTSYHLSCTVDDNIQGVSLVTRAEDLTLATHIHRLLQQLLDYKVPEYKFHKIIVDENGDRLAKRVKSKTIYAMRKAGLTASDIRLAVGL